MVKLMDLNIENKTKLLSNLSFDHPLSDSELSDLINLLASPINLSQIYFKDDIDIASIEKVKLLLEGLPTIDDAKIEKYILKKIDENDDMILSNMSFLNIDTWNIAYSKDENRCSITTMAKYRKIKEWFNESRCLKNSENNFNEVLKMYDRVKLFDYDGKSKYGRLPEIISEGKANSYGYNLLFKELLNMNNVPAILVKVNVDNEINYVTLAHLKDKENDIDGLYIFDPSSDTISKDQYRNNLARRINYNFFGIKLDKFLKQKSNIKEEGILKVLTAPNSFEFEYLLTQYNERNGCNEIREIERVFKTKPKDFYNKLHDTMEIESDIMFGKISNRLAQYNIAGIDKDLFDKTVIENYMLRDNELFKTVHSKNQIKYYDKTSLGVDIAS